MYSVNGQTYSCEVLLPTGEWMKGLINEVHPMDPVFQVEVLIKVEAGRKWIITTQRRNVRNVRGILKNFRGRLESLVDLEYCTTTAARLEE